MKTWKKEGKKGNGIRRISETQKGRGEAVAPGGRKRKKERERMYVCVRIFVDTMKTNKAGPDVP